MSKFCFKHAVPNGYFLALQVIGDDNESKNTWVCRAYLEAETGTRIEWTDEELREGVIYQLKRSDNGYFGRTEVSFMDNEQSFAVLKACIYKPQPHDLEQIDSKTLYGRKCCIYNAVGENGDIDAQRLAFRMSRS